MKKKYLLAVAFLLSMTTGLASCSEDEPIIEQQQPNVSDSENNGNEETPNSNKMNIKIENRTFTVTLADNETAGAFKAMMPMTITMNEMNGNEKYYNLPDNLPTDSYRPGTIQKGDLMLYGSNCLVLFYETFASSYNYTRIGKVDNTAGLTEAVGSGNVNVIVEIQN